MNKPMILAFVGPSASGKDTLARKVCGRLKKQGNLLVLDTTRKPRLGEDKDCYNFVNGDLEFFQNVYEDKYFGYFKFGYWYYGLRRDSIKKDKINVGVFSLAQLAALQKTGQYEIIVVYCKCNSVKRLSRSIKRDGKLKREHVRRLFSDWNDFFDIKSFLANFPKVIEINTNKTETLSATLTVLNFLNTWSFLQKDK